MKCPHCSMEWTDRAGITDAMKRCPFCGGSLAPRKDPENLAECLQQLHSQFGVEPFRLGQRLISLHSDLMPQHTRDRRMLTILVNCGGHTALLDALKSVRIPAVEVHISNVSEREEFRQISYVRLACQKTITGHGTDGYLEAIEYLAERN